MATSSTSTLWRVRPAESTGTGRELSFGRLSDAVATEIVGDLDEVLGPGETRWRKVAEHPQLALYVPHNRGSRIRLIEDAESDMTPMIDVTFQLLIFFMICATYVVQKTLTWPNSRPDPEAAATVTLEELNKSHVLVRVDGHDQVSVDGQPVEASRLERELEAAIRKVGSAEILLDVDDAAKHETVAQVLDAAGAADVEQVLYVSRGPAAPGAPAGDE